MHELIPTKIAPPMWMGDQIRRDALLAELDRAFDRRLTLIHAPAGYGKTSLLTQWRRRLDEGTAKIAWLTLEREDADLKRLSQYLWFALDEGDEGDHLSSDLPPRAALSAIINRLARETRPVVLILDDLHHAEGAEVNEFLSGLIRLAPDHCHFILASRDYPWVGQSVLAAEEQLLELTADELKFSEPEAGALLARVEGVALDGENVRQIVERTEGWPIALQLASLSLKRGVDQQQLVDRLGGPSAELGRYLSEQVLVTLPPETQDLVIRTAVLDRLTGDLVNLLCDRSDGWVMLERLEEQGVFLTPVSPDRAAYRYHQLFAGYLRERLQRRDGALYRALHGRAAEWFAERGELADAVEHAIQAGDNDELARILDNAGGWRLIPHGLQAVIQRGLDTLPDAVVNAYPLLAMARVYLQIKCGELGQARVVYDRFVDNAVDDELSADTWIEIRVVGDVLADYENTPVTLEDLLAREALLRTLPSSDHLILANISETLGAKYFELGSLERALEPTLAAREHYQAMGSLYSDLFTRFLEARIKRAQGRLKDSATILGNARAQIEASFGERSDLAANCAAFEAELLYEQDRRAEASALLDWALPHMEQSDGWVDVYAAAYFTAARAAAADGLADDAHAMIARAKRVAGRRRLVQLEQLAGLCEIELLLHYEPDADAARDYARQIGLDALADQMTLASPAYRPVAAAASLNRCRLRLIDGEIDAAIAELTQLKRWASQHGAGRLLIDVDLLLAHALRETDAITEAQAAFDDAVGAAMFQGIVRPFADAGRFAAGALEDCESRTSPADRFRAQFLKTLSRAVAVRPTDPGAQRLLNDAETAILVHLSSGYSNKEIARLIGMSPDTVKYRLKSVFKKIGVSKRRDAVRVSHERGLITSDAHDTA